MDLLPRNDPGKPSTQFTMPTALERAGDFSQTRGTARETAVHQGSALFSPGLACNVSTGGPAVPGNIIPSNRIDPIGQAILDLFPLPNTADPTGRAPVQLRYQNDTRRRNDQVLRVDYNVGPKMTYYSRVQFGNEVNDIGATRDLGGGSLGARQRRLAADSSSEDIGTVSRSTP